MFTTIGMFFGAAAGGSGLMFWPIKLTGFGAPIPVPKKLAEIKVGEVLPVREGKFYLTRTDDGLMALYWKCVHLGCTVPWVQGENLFMCPCHGSHYDITGQNVAGPAPRPLDYMEMEVGKDGTIVVNTGKIHQRTKYEPTQATKV
ncbi:MAG TPA: Rieske 2Fe-2S domain-containing protein [Symbiobacteriaceae bacterium]|jgi:cytochrome b6-f complex iron-sulfur subunit